LTFSKRLNGFSELHRGAVSQPEEPHLHRR
jgi:hypothetical protein